MEVNPVVVRIDGVPMDCLCPIVGIPSQDRADLGCQTLVGGPVDGCPIVVDVSARADCPALRA